MLSRGNSHGSWTVANIVHNHGPEEGLGLDCPESTVNGQLKGACLTGLNFRYAVSENSSVLEPGVFFILALWLDEPMPLTSEHHHVFEPYEGIGLGYFRCARCGRMALSVNE